LSILLSFFSSTAEARPPEWQVPYPEEWWRPVPREGAPSWELLPQDAGFGEVILSKRHELGILSNFAATPFTLDGARYASVEGLWQMMKYPEGEADERLRDPSIHWPHTRAEVAEMTAFEAKEAGNKANELMKRLGIRWVTYQGRRMDYLEKVKGDFFRVIQRAEWEKLRQNPRVKEVLLRTGALKLRPDHTQAPDSPPAWLYAELWMEIREELRQQK